MSNMLQIWGERIEQLGPLAKRAGDKADDYANRVIERLNAINSSIRGLYGVNPTESHRLTFAGVGVKVIEPREGYQKRLLVLSSKGAAGVEIYMGVHNDSGFFARVASAATGSILAVPQPITIPEGTPIIIAVDAACQVNIILERITA